MSATETPAVLFHMKPERLARLAVVSVLVGALMGTLLVVLWTTDVRLIDLLRNPREVGAPFRHWVEQRPILAPIIFILVYCCFALMMLPLWWLQVLAGVGFGLVGGLTWVLTAAAIAAGSGLNLSRWVARDWFQRRIESRMPRLRRLEEKLGHNGLLVVIVARLIRGVPFGATNYALGLTRITTPDVVVGTILGSAPGVAVYVMLGNDPAMLADFRFIATIAAMVIVLLIPLLLRYLRPQWFRRIGIE
jgi:uncharacterized membrane protein YdjX (TVP38/TMEM64 family)